MIKSLVFIFLSFILISCNDKNGSSKSMQDARELEAARTEKLRAQQQLEKDQNAAKLKEEEEEAKLAAKEAAKKSEELEKLKIDQELERLAAEKEAERLADIQRRQVAQQRALNQYIGTKYDELELLDGKILKSAEVTNATATQITYMHKNGIAKVKYDNLPKAISEKCCYDPELDLIAIKEEKDTEKKMYEARKEALKSNKSLTNNDRASRKETAKRASRSITATPRAKSTKDEEKKKVVREKGMLSVRVVGQSRGSKTINVGARSNVDATLYLNDWYWRRNYSYEVKAGVSFSHVWRGVSNKYEVKLVSKKGKVLDREAYNNKSGL